MRRLGSSSGVSVQFFFGFPNRRLTLLYFCFRRVSLHVGSEIHLYGDTGPAYGAYSLQLDQGTPDLRSAFYPALAVGPAHYLYSLRNLTEGRHELVITNLGTREGLVEGEGFLLDYVLVTQKVGPVSG